MSKNTYLQHCLRLYTVGAMRIIVAATLVVMCLCYITYETIQAQPIAPQPPPKSQTKFVNKILFEMQDMRLNCINEDQLNEKRTCGVVSLCTALRFEGEGCLEYSVANYRTISDVLGERGWIKRKTHKPQIRIIKKDIILQSSIDDTNTLSGFSAQFLQQKLDAGDIMVVLPRYD